LERKRKSLAPLTSGNGERGGGGKDLNQTADPFRTKKKEPPIPATLKKQPRNRNSNKEKREKKRKEKKKKNTAKVIIVVVEQVVRNAVPGTVSTAV